MAFTLCAALSHSPESGTFFCHLKNVMPQCHVWTEDLLAQLLTVIAVQVVIALVTERPLLNKKAIIGDSGSLLFTINKGQEWWMRLWHRPGR